MNHKISKEIETFKEEVLTSLLETPDTDVESALENFD